MSYEEVEVKFIVDDLPAMRQRLLTMGATLHIPRTYEDNVLFDTRDRRLVQQQALLRLRRDRRNLLTYKAPPPADEAEFKVRQEYEVEVSDGSQMRAILEKLGFFPSMRYEKYRETFTYQRAEIVLDEVPVGAFMEIEASREAIRSIAARLGLDFGARLTASYSDIFDAVRAAYQLQMTDMTFANFCPLDIDLHACHLT
jgi:adenylate cyclase class 2